MMQAPFVDLSFHITRLFVAPAPSEWSHFVVVLFSLGGMIGLSELVRRQLGWKAEVTRKFVHVAVGVLIFFAPSLFRAALIPMLFAATFVVADTVAIRKGLLVGIHGTSRYSYGTMFYPLSFLTLTILFWYDAPEIVSLSMASLALGDASAAIVGETLRAPHEYRLTTDKKSVEGSVTMAIVTLGTLLGGMAVLGLPARFQWSMLVWSAVAASAVATAWEAISSKGFDNFTVPMSTAVVLSVFLSSAPGHDREQLLLGLVLAAGIAAVSWIARFLTANGSVAVFLLASAVFGLGGWKWTVPILTFFVLSSFLSITGGGRKKGLEAIFEKTGARDSGQVAANGAVAGFIVLAQYALPQVDFFPMYLGAVAAVTADTWGTEIGTLVRGATVELRGLRRVPPGTNGGVSIAGVAAGVLGAGIVAASAVPWISVPKSLWIVPAAGVTGSAVDSLLGSTVQARFRCHVCGKLTERQMHCGGATELTEGFRWLRNDAVNWLCGLTGAVSAWFLMDVLH